MEWIDNDCKCVLWYGSNVGIESRKKKYKARKNLKRKIKHKMSTHKRSHSIQTMKRKLSHASNSQTRVNSFLLCMLIYRYILFVCVVVDSSLACQEKKNARKWCEREKKVCDRSEKSERKQLTHCLSSITFFSHSLSMSLHSRRMHRSRNLM